MGWTVFSVLQETERRIRGTKKRTTQEAVDVEALIMRLTYKEPPIALHDIRQCSESLFSDGWCINRDLPTSSPRNGFPDL